MRLDKNGYAPTILDSERGECFLCGRRGETARHEVFHGPYRQKSKAFGLWVYLCPECHSAIHEGGDYERGLKRYAQECAMMDYCLTVRDFIREFGKNYTEVEA